MNPMFQAAAGSILRWAFAIAAGYLVNHGIWAKSDADLYVGAASLATLSLIWGLWNKYRGRLKFLSALQLGGATEHEVEARIADPLIPNPSVRTAKSEIPL